MELPRWTREPLVHFLIAGSLIFLFFAWKGEPVDPASRSISIDREQQVQLALSFERTMRRAPTDAELDNLIERHVRDEVLYREALRLGLDQGDAVVRRRLSQKMDMLASARAETAVPSEEVLQAWLGRHPERFADEVEYSLDQIWFASQPAARAGLVRIGEGADWREVGERISLPMSVEAERRGEIFTQFGEGFVGELDQLVASLDWQGPILSGLGWHLVRLRERQVGAVPTLNNVRERVENDWRSSTISQRRDEAYQLLRDAYQVDIAR